MIKLWSVVQCLDQFAPFAYQESYDNSGLLTGDPDMDVNGAILCLDVTEEVLDEAMQKGYNLIIAHHPIIFSGLKQITGRNYIERIVKKAIQKDIAIIAYHTNVDNIKLGVNHKMANKLGLQNTRILSPVMDSLKLVYVYTPPDHTDRIRQAMHDAGAGKIGLYDQCSFYHEGTGTYRPLTGANPFLGSVNNLSSEHEVKLEMVCAGFQEKSVIAAMKQAHPYEEIAYGVLPISVANPYVGSGLIGELPQPQPSLDFLHNLKKVFDVKAIRHTAIHKETIQRVALCGGSGSFLLPQAKSQGADIFITADFKYHQFFDADHKIIIVDIGHYESEQFTPEIFYDLLSEKFPTFALQITSVVTNPVQYL